MKIDAVALMEVLKSEKELHQELLQLSREEHELIIEHNTAKLLKIVEAKENLLVRIRVLEKKRLLVSSGGMDQSLTKTPSDLSSIIQDLGEPLASEAEKLRAELILIVKDLAEVNQTNAELMKRNMGYIEFLLRAITSNQNPVYSNKPNPQSSTPKLFDGRA